MSRFSGKTVIITGASSGIGAATADRFSAEGANVVAMSRSRDTLEERLGGLPSDRTLIAPGDISKPDDVRSVVDQAIDRFGAIDVLVNNAAVVVTGDVTATSDEDWVKLIDVNVNGYFRMTKAAMPHLKAAKGAVVMTSSVSGLGGDWGMVAYNASKGAVTNMVRAMAMDHGADGVRVNAVCPSFTDTGMTKDMQNDDTIKAFMRRIPMKRIGQPEDVAAVIAFLASDDAGFVTGVNLPVDGGLSASNGQPAL